MRCERTWTRRVACYVLGITALALARMIGADHKHRFTDCYRIVTVVQKLPSFTEGNKMDEHRMSKNQERYRTVQRK